MAGEHEMNDGTIKMSMLLDPDDFAALTAEIEYRRDRPLPDGTSDRLGSLVGEICRDLVDYRNMYVSNSMIVRKSDVRDVMLAFRSRCPADAYGEHAINVIDTLMDDLGLEAADG